VLTCENNIMWALFRAMFIRHISWIFFMETSDVFLCAKKRFLSVHWRLCVLFISLKMCQHLRKNMIWFKNVFVLYHYSVPSVCEARIYQASPCLFRLYKVRNLIKDVWKPSYCVLEFLGFSLLFVSFSCVTLIQA
jgi:hypothetical protein